ncbi:Larval cuticle protein 16/17 [Amphibalanus amphitrite]|uniref:Larval cuticle protein 16/17 n=1 Tax=Amphibalanus amphitrite TaxID=1232801 RepID=A0A6A4VZ35_AMPAM|nr:Larval cuticle protein 16/17 [Amphibalanus amphitrite]
MLGKVILVAVIGAVLAQKPEEVRSGLQDVAILNEKRSHDVSGKYDFGFAAEDGTARVEEKTDDGEVRGQYQYVNDDGETVVVKYTAADL